MFRNILIPVNLSTKEQQLVETIVDLLGSSVEEATLLHVIEEIEGLTGDEGGRFYSGLRDRAEKALIERAQPLARAGLKPNCEVLIGRRAAVIVDAAAERGCDLIVMGSRPLDPESPGRGLWTTSQKVSLLAECPVLLLR